MKDISQFNFPATWSLAYYKDQLRQHDWYSDYSDDAKVRIKWSIAFGLLERAQARLDPEAVIWNAFAPLMARKFWGRGHTSEENSWWRNIRDGMYD